MNGWERKDALQKETQYEEKEKRVRMEKDIRERVALEEGKKESVSITNGR